MDQRIVQPPMAMCGAPLPADNASKEKQLMMQVNEYRKKYQHAVDVQTQMEEEMVSLTGMVGDMQQELARAKAAHQKTQNELAQVTKEMINQQTKWLEQVSSLNEEISTLQMRLRIEHQQTEQAQAHARASEEKIEKILHRRESTPPAPGTPQAKRAEELLKSELIARHEQIKNQLDQTEQVNSRLQEENEALQLLVAEKTITGETLDLEFGATLEQELGNSDLVTHNKKLKFDLRVANDYNQALRVSLESLVQRLLEDKEFSSAMETSIGYRKVSEFCERTRQASRVTSRSAIQPPQSVGINSAYWTNILVSSHKHSKAQQRIVSNGVDDHLDDSASISSHSSTLVSSDIYIPKRPVTANQRGLRKLSIGS